MTLSLENLIGVGIYSIPEASNLIGLPTSRVRRWIKGYSINKEKSYKPVMPTELPKVEGKTALSFYDLLELRFIKEFLDHGVSLPKIRQAAQIAAEILNVDSHPFIRHKFMTDRKNILHSVDEKMLNLNNEQYELEDIIKQSLFKSFIYENNIAAAWHPSINEKTIILDPKYSLGKPINERTGIRTRTIFYAWKSEGGDNKTVAKMFDLKVREVIEAVKFEKHLLQA